MVVACALAGQSPVCDLSAAAFLSLWAGLEEWKEVEESSVHILNEIHPVFPSAREVILNPSLKKKKKKNYRNLRYVKIMEVTCGIEAVHLCCFESGGFGKNKRM